MSKININLAKFMFTDTTNFNNILTPAEDTIQKSLEKLDISYPNMTNIKQSISYIDNLSQSSTTSYNWQTKLTNTFELLESRVIVIDWTCALWNTSSKLIYSRVILNDSVVLSNNIYKPGNNNEKSMMNGTSYRLNLNPGTHNVSIQYNASNSGTTYIDDAAIDVMGLF